MKASATSRAFRTLLQASVTSKTGQDSPVRAATMWALAGSWTSALEAANSSRSTSPVRGPPGPGHGRRHGSRGRRASRRPRRRALPASRHAAVPSEREPDVRRRGLLGAGRPKESRQFAAARRRPGTGAPSPKPSTTTADWPRRPPAPHRRCAASMRLGFDDVQSGDDHGTTAREHRSSTGRRRPPRHRAARWCGRSGPWCY